MPLDEFIINMYIMVEHYYNKVVTAPLRQGGYSPKLSDPEVICMEIVGEFLNMDQDKQIWQYFDQHWRSWFPALGSYPNFCKHCANLWQVKERMQASISQTQGDDNIHFIDGLPIPVCKYARANRHKTFKADAEFSYCASKTEYYYGFKGHLLINMSGMIKGFTYAAANIDERDIAPELVEGIHGLLGADKGYIRPALTEHLHSQGVDLQTPLRRNMNDDRPKALVSTLMRARRMVETVISQLSERFNLQKVRARDLWHASHRFIRKILSHNLCFVLNKQLGNPPLQFELLISS